MKLRIALLVCCVGIAALLPLRLVELFTLVDLQSGLFTGPHPLIPLYYLLLTVFSLAFFVLAACSHKVLDTTPVRGGIPLGVTGVLTGGGLAFDSIRSLFHLGGDGIIPVMSLLTAVLGCVSAAAIILFSLLLTNGYLSGAWRVLPTFPVFWMAVRIISFFFANLVVIPLSQKILDVFWMLAQLLFLLAFARCVCGFRSRAGKQRAVVFGFCSVLIGLPAYLSWYLLPLLRDLPPESAFLPLPGVSDLMLCIFTLVFLAPLAWTAGQNRKTRYGGPATASGSYYYHSRTRYWKRSE